PGARCDLCRPGRNPVPLGRASRSATDSMRRITMPRSHSMMTELRRSAFTPRRVRSPENGPKAGALLLTMLATAPAFTRADTTADSPEENALQEVVVTARLRSESLMKVPDTIKVFSPAEIADRQLVQLDDFIHLTPNAKIIREQDIATSELYIRGVGSNKGQ